MGGYSGSRNSQLKNRPLKVDFRKASTKCSKFCNKYSYRPHFVVEATQKSCDLCSVYVFVRYLTVHIVSIDCTFIFINTNRIKISTFLFNFINNLLMQKRHTKQTDPNMFLKWTRNWAFWLLLLKQRDKRTRQWLESRFFYNVENQN